MTNKGSGETVHKCSLVMNIPCSHIRNIGQGNSEETCAQVQSRQNLPCSHTHNGAYVARQGSGEIVHKCSLVRIFPAHIHTMGHMWPGKVQGRLCTSAVSSESSLLTYTLWGICGQARFRGDCAQAHSRQNLPCSHTHNGAYVARQGSGEIVHKCSLVRIFPAHIHTMGQMWPGKVQGRLCTSALSSESSLLTYTLLGICEQARFRGDCAQVQSRQNLPCSHTHYGAYVSRQGSGEIVHKCSLVRIFPAHIHTMGHM